MPKEYKHYGNWIGKSSAEYEAEIMKLKLENMKLKNNPQLPVWSEGLWEQMAHELVWVIGVLEEEPTSPKAWRKVFGVLKAYEELVRTGKAK